MITLGVIITILLLVIIYLTLPGGPALNKYVSAVRTSFQEIPNSSEEKVFTEDALAELPKSLQRYIRKNGYLNQPLMNNVLIRFKNTKFRMAADKDPISIDFCQVNFVNRPDRLAFLEARMFGLPVHVQDSIQDGKGSMIGVLAKHFQLFHSTGPEMDQGQLITALADAVFMPALFLQDYVTWGEINDNIIEGKISWKGVSATGRFTFDETGDIIRFDTEDRYMDENGKGTSLIPWYVLYENYQTTDGFRRPGFVSVNWVLPEGVDTYFVSHKINVEYSVDLFKVK